MNLSILRNGSARRAAKRLSLELRNAGDPAAAFGYCIVWELVTGDDHRIEVHTGWEVPSEALSAAALKVDDFGRHTKVASVRVCHATELAIDEIEAITA
jgi:hypothetical protein